MNKRIWLFSVLVIAFSYLTQDALAWQAKQKATTKRPQPIRKVEIPPGGELVSPAMHDRASKIGKDYWDKRLTNCGQENTFYFTEGSGRINDHNDEETVGFIEVANPRIETDPHLYARSRADIMNGLEWKGIIKVYGITRSYNKAWSKHMEKTNYFSGPVVLIDLEIINGVVRIGGIREVYLPVDCKDVPSNDQQNTVMLRSVYLDWLRSNVNFEGKCFPPLAGVDWIYPPDCGFYNTNKPKIRPRP